MFKWEQYAMPGRITHRWHVPAGIKGGRRLDCSPHISSSDAVPNQPQSCSFRRDRRFQSDMLGLLLPVAASTSGDRHGDRRFTRRMHFVGGSPPWPLRQLSGRQLIRWLRDPLLLGPSRTLESRCRWRVGGITRSRQRTRRLGLRRPRAGRSAVDAA